MVKKCYNTCCLIKKEEEYFMVDTGAGNVFVAYDLERIIL